MRLLVVLVAIAGCAEAPAYDHGAELGVLAGKSDGQPAPKKQWSVLLYGAADNNLADSILRDINELESAGSSADVNFLAFIDRPEGASVMYLVADSDLRRLN